MKKFYVPEDLMLYSNSMQLNSDFAVHGFCGGASKDTTTLVTEHARIVPSISFVGSVSAAAAGPSNVVLSMPVNAQVGDLFIVFTGVYATATSSLDPTGYTRIGERLCNDTYDGRLTAWYKFLTADDASVVLENAATDSAQASIGFVFRGVDQSTPLDVAAVLANGGNSGVANPPAITPVSDGAMIVICGLCAGAYSYSYTATVPSGFENLVNQSCTAAAGSSENLAVAAMLQESATTVDPDQFIGFNTSSNSSWAAMTLALKAA